MSHNYMFLYYDIDEKRVQKVFKICKKYLMHVQNSVFRGEITPSATMKLKEELMQVIAGEDEIVFIKLMNQKSFDEEVITKTSKNDEKEPTNFL